MNQQQDREDDVRTKPLADLPLSGEQAEETKAGAVGVAGGGGFGAGKVHVHD